MGNPSWEKGQSGNSSGRPKGKSIGKWLVELGEQSDASGLPRNHFIAKKLIAIAMDEKTPAKTVLEIAQFATERIDGKPTQANVNFEVEANPFVDIDTETLTKLREQLAKAQQELTEKK